MTIAFCGCHLKPLHSPNDPAQSHRREVVVSGKRIKTVDIHAHCAVGESASP